METGSPRERKVRRIDSLKIELVIPHIYTAAGNCRNANAFFVKNLRRFEDRFLNEPFYTSERNKQITHLMRKRGR